MGGERVSDEGMGMKISWGGGFSFSSIFSCVY